MTQAQTAELNADASEGEGTKVAIQKTDAAKKKIKKGFAEMEDLKQQRKELNEEISAIQEGMVTIGISRKAQKIVKAYMDLSDEERDQVDEQVAFVRETLGKPMQGRLELVH